MNNSSAIQKAITILYGMADAMNNKEWEDAAKQASAEYEALSKRAKFDLIGTDCLCPKDGSPYRFCPIHGNKGSPR